MENFIEGPQGRLHVSVDGDPASPLPVMLIHSDLGTLHHWDEIRAGLASRYATIAYDRRGHGLSDSPRDGSFRHDGAARDVLAVADALGLQRFALIGHSGGALTAWSSAVAETKRIAGVLLVDPPVDARTLPAGLIEGTLAAIRGPDYRKVTEDYYRSIAGPNRAVADRVVADALATPQATMVGGFEALRDFDARHLAGRYPGSMLSIIQPAFDIPGALHRIDPSIAHIAMSGTGHWIHLDAPESFLDRATEFLSGLHTG